MRPNIEKIPKRQNRKPNDYRRRCVPKTEGPPPLWAEGFFPTGKEIRHMARNYPNYIHMKDNKHLYDQLGDRIIARDEILPVLKTCSIVEITRSNQHIVVYGENGWGRLMHVVLGIRHHVPGLFCISAYYPDERWQTPTRRSNRKPAA